MAVQNETKFFTVYNKRSNVCYDKDGGVISGNEQPSFGSEPKIISPDKLNYGEIAINYRKGLETISFKNSKDEVVSLQKEVLVIDNSNKDEYLDENGNLKVATTAKIVLDLTDDSAEEYLDFNNKFVNFMKQVNVITQAANGDIILKTDGHLSTVELNKDGEVKIDGELDGGYEICLVLKNNTDSSINVTLPSAKTLEVQSNSIGQLIFISDGENIYGRIV